MTFLLFKLVYHQNRVNQINQITKTIRFGKSNIAIGLVK